KEDQEYSLIKESGQFDEKYYVEKYPGYKNSKLDPIRHFLRFGFKVNTNPNKYFNTSYYSNKYKDVKASQINVFVHYLVFGKSENRFINQRSQIVQKQKSQIDVKDETKYFVDYTKKNSLDTKLKTIAFYLPQFHPFKENDEWWGKGFTEWTNVTKAKPNFEGHYQPHLPIHNGFYDLRLPEVMIEQARLAKNYGIHGFNFYYYWFDGKILMNKPFEILLKHKEIDINFCITWANENWTRRWDGLENEVLISQNHSDEDSIKFIKNLFKYFEDDRYIRVDNKPLLIIYRSSIIPNMKKTGEIWREEAKKAGFEGLYLVCAQTSGTDAPYKIGFDAAMEFPPHTVYSEKINENIEFFDKNFNGTVFDYNQVVDHACQKHEPNYKLFRTAMLSWDNTARRENNATTFHNFNINGYKKWLTHISNNTLQNSKYSEDEKFVFINAWNEWAEGTHLEPDNKYGYAYLESTYDILKKGSDKKKEIDLVIFVSSENIKDLLQKEILKEHLTWLTEKTFIKILLVFDKEDKIINEFKTSYDTCTLDFLGKPSLLLNSLEKIKGIYVYNIKDSYIFDELKKLTIPTIYNQEYCQVNNNMNKSFCAYRDESNSEIYKYQLFMKLLYSETDFDPTVSIIVPSYNHANYLEQRLNSIFEQTFQDYELIILDDKSPDNSENVILELIKDRPNVYFERNIKNSGSPFIQWSKGIELARSDIIWIAEDDDFCEKNFLHKLLPSFDNERVRLAYSQSHMIDENNHIIGNYQEIFSKVSSEKWNSDYIIPAYEEIKKSLAIRNTIPNASAVLFKKFDISSILNELTTFKFAGDWYFYLNCIQEGDVSFVKDSLNYHRRHSASTMSVLKDDHQLYFNEIKKIHDFAIKTFVLENSTFDKISDYLIGEFKYRKLNIDNSFYSLKTIQDIRREQKYNFELNIVVVISGYYFGGAEIFPINIANSFADLGHKTFLLDSGTLEEDKRVSNMVSPLVEKVKFDKNENLSQEIESFLKVNKINIINTQGWMATDFIQKNLTKVSTPWFASLHGHEENIINGGWTTEYIQYFEKAFKNTLSLRPTFIYTHNKNLEAFEVYGESGYKFLEEIPTLGMPKKLPPKKLKSQLNIRKTDKVVGFVARGIEEKGWQEVIDSSIIINEEYEISTHFILIGDSDYVQELKRTYSTKKYLHFIGLSDEVLAWNQIFDIALLPSFYKSESHPLVIMGYLLCGNPVITTPLGNIPEMLSYNGLVAGKLLDIKDHGRTDSLELAESIYSYLDNEKLYKEHSKLAKRAFEKFDMAIGANKYIQAFQKKCIKKNLYIHIGLPKTGTSAIQKFLVDNTRVLREKHNLYYPDFGQWVDGSHHKIAFALGNNPYEEMKSND
ncbi:MAG TPA: glycosyltransferase, partial [Arcobacter sp.]|nr:glycosyltransferase [Arcobacter sp.]